MSIQTITIWIIVAGGLFFAVPLEARQTDPVRDTDIEPFAISGNIGFLSEGYAVSGIDQRRPSAMSQITANTHFSIFGFRSGINLLYSTEDDRFRQSMNRFNFHGSWRWLTVSAGTVSPNFSKYSLGGIRVDGGMIEIAPQGFSLSLSAGRTRRSVEMSDQPGFREPSFERWLFAGRVGLGNRGRNEFAITGVYAYDVIRSIEDPGDVMPAENLSITPQFSLLLFQNRVTLESNVTVSAFTRDRRSDRLDLSEEGIPEFVTAIFTPRRSSRVDFAGEAAAGIDLGSLRLNGGYERIQPGFRSLGLGRVRSDQQTYRFRPQLRIAGGRVNLAGQFSQSSNNLLDTRVSTTRRRQIGGNSTIRITGTVTFNLSYMRMTNENNPVDSEAAGAADLHQRQVSQNFMLSPIITFRSNGAAHSISLNSSYQVLDDKSEAVVNGERPASDFDNINLGLNYGITLRSGLNLSAAGNLMKSKTETTEATGNAVNISAGYAFFDRSLNVSLNAGWSRNGTEFSRVITEEERRANALMQASGQGELENNQDDPLADYEVRRWSRQYKLNLTASYRLPNGNPIRLIVRGVSSGMIEGEGREFNEFNTSLRYTHRF